MTTDLDLDDVAAQSPKAQRELEELRKDAERYRWHLAQNPTSLLLNAWSSSKTACNIGADCDAATDAAMADTKTLKTEL